MAGEPLWKNAQHSPQRGHPDLTEGHACGSGGKHRTPAELARNPARGTHRKSALRNTTRAAHTRRLTRVTARQNRR